VLDFGSFKNKKIVNSPALAFACILSSYVFVSGITDLMGQAGLEAPDNNDSIMSKGSNVASTTNTDNTAVL
jgi:hypothetical protein